MIRRIYAWALIGVVLSCLIFPNSLKVTSAVSLTVAFLCSITGVKIDANLFLILKFWVMASLVTVLYILVGVINGAPTEAVIQVLLIYIVFPIMWIFVIKYFLQEVPLDLAVRGLIAVGVVACLSVLFFYYAFLNYGPEYVEFFIESPNVDVGTDGYIAATMYVFGSLIFIVGGYIASYSLLPRRRKSAILLSLFIFVTLISGRGALVLCVIIGLLLNCIAVGTSFKQTKASGFLKDTFWLIFACALVFITLGYFGLRLDQIVDPVIEKLTSLGGAGRNEQFFALMNGIEESTGLGLGHGIGVSYKVNEVFPWRYEMVWAASVFRVGFIGATIYAAPFVLAFALGFHRLLKGGLNGNEMFIFGGFVSAFVASNTNPYIEALVFQWMFILPVLYFTMNGRHLVGHKGKSLQP